MELRSKDSASKWPFALDWIRGESARLGWVVCKVREDKDGSVCGQMLRVTGVVENPGGGRVIVSVDKSKRYVVEIRDFDGYGFPSVVVKAFLPGESVYGGEYRVYHEYHFDARPVFHLKRILGADTLFQADTGAFIQRVARRVARFVWWRAFLQREARLGKERDIGVLLAALINS